MSNLNIQAEPLSDEAKQAMDDTAITEGLPEIEISLLSAELDDTASRALNVAQPKATALKIRDRPEDCCQLLHQAKERDRPFYLFLDDAWLRLLLQNYTISDNYAKMAVSTFTNRNYFDGMAELPDINLNFVVPLKGTSHRVEDVLAILLLLGDPRVHDMVGIKIAFDAYGTDTPKLALIITRVQISYSVQNMYFTLNLFGKIDEPVPE